jgi:hypothetical protein
MDNGEKAFRALWRWLADKWDMYAFAEDSWATRILTEGLEEAQKLNDEYLEASDKAPSPDINPEVCKECGSSEDWLYKTTRPSTEWNIIRCISCGIIYRQRMFKESGEEFWETADILLPYPPEETKE